MVTGVPALGWWLMVIGAVRLAFTWSGFFDTAALGSATYAQAQSAMSVILISAHSGCGRCCRARSASSAPSTSGLGSRPLYAATFMSFVYGYGHFIVEYLVYNTYPAANLGTIGFLAEEFHGHGPRIAAKPS
ncbi:unnamed protein product [Urochloa decumbens]|uniref:Ergosterol biosynthetic protein 28 n=1 Tax=Urochloa decumbens TaxID=240449 RepID=A0ABC8X0I6_9POAL